MRDRGRTHFLTATWTTRVGAGEIGSQCAQAPGNTRWGPRTTDRRVIGSRAHAQAAYQVLLHSPPPARETEMRCNATRPSTDRGEVALFARAVRSVQRSPRRKVNTPAPGHVLSHEARAHPLAARCELLGRRPREQKGRKAAELLLSYGLKPAEVCEVFEPSSGSYEETRFRDFWNEINHCWNRSDRGPRSDQGPH